MGQLERRSYDILRLIEAHGPIGSIRLNDLLERYGYTINDRTIRLTLSELDEAGYTTKIPGKGRRLTEDGRTELRRGDVTGRLGEVRARIAQLTSRVTYDPDADEGKLVAAAAFLDRSDLTEAMAVLEPIRASPLGPPLVAVDESFPSREEETVALCFPSSITLDGVLLTRAVDATLESAGLVQYHPDPDPEVPHIGTLASDNGGAVLRYTDALSGEGSTVDVATLFIEAGRVDPAQALVGEEPAQLLVDNRTVPMTHFETAESLAELTRERLGGVVDIRKPREDGPFPVGKPGWGFASITYGGMGEFALARLDEAGLTDNWETLYGLLSRREFSEPGDEHDEERLLDDL